MNQIIQHLKKTLTLDATKIDLINHIISEEKFTAKQEVSCINEIDEALNKKYTTLDLVYYGEPKAQARHRISQLANHMYDPSMGLKEWLVSQIIHQLPKNFKLVDSEIFMSLKFYRSIPKSTPKNKKILMEAGILLPSKKPDLDNYIKLVQDALNKVLYVDDSQIVLLNSEKFYSSKPRVEITLTF
jgi:Holliday junction resolvase RusA-like endonuclease